MSEDDGVLNEILSKVAKEQGYENFQISTKRITTDGANYTSFLYRATVSAQEKDDLKLFVKVAAAGEKMRSVAPFRIFEIESFAYKQLLKKYKELEEKYEVPVEDRLLMPQFYGCSEEYLNEVLVLEDLSASGYKTYDRLKSIDWAYASKSVQNLAKFHALSIAWSIIEPEEFAKTETINFDSNMDGVAQYLNRVIAGAIEVIREENQERLSKYVKNTMDNKDNLLLYYKSLRRPVISHGDYRPSNLMHRVNEDGSIDLISLDYQTLQRGNPIIDLMYFIFTGSDKDFRDKHYRQTLDHYYTELCAALSRLDLKPDEIYPKSDFEYELQKVLPYGLITGMFCLLLVTVDVEDAPKVSKDIEMSDFAMNPSTLYKQRLNEIVDDYISMGLF